MILLDTHALLWWFSDPARLPERARRAIHSALRRGPLTASAISVFEIATAVRRGRLDLGRSTEKWLADLRTLPELRFQPLNPEIARAAGDLPATLHGDPVDRIIAATALALDATLVTADRQLRESSLIRTVW